MADLASAHPAPAPEADPDVDWIRLEILDVVAGAAGDSGGEVEFRAYYRSTDLDLPGTRVLHRRSRFTVRAAGSTSTMAWIRTDRRLPGAELVSGVIAVEC